MKKILLVMLLLLIALVSLWWFTKDEDAEPEDDRPDTAISVSKLSDKMGAAVDAMLTNYFNLKEAFVKGDTGLIAINSSDLQKALGDLPIDEMEKDSIFSTINDKFGSIKTELLAQIQESDLENKRMAFQMVSENIYDFIRIIKYDRKTIYHLSFQKDENREWYWLSNSRNSENPYGGNGQVMIKDSLMAGK